MVPLLCVTMYQFILFYGVGTLEDYISLLSPPLDAHIMA
jgi:hypothetical protein